MSLVPPVEIDECDSDPCMNGGVCIDEIDRYTCNCTGTGYEGDRCQNGELFSQWWHLSAHSMSAFLSLGTQPEDVVSVHVFFHLKHEA